MRQTTTTLLAYFSSLIFLTSSLSAVSLYEQTTLNLGKKYEKDGNFEKALAIYVNYQNENAHSEQIAQRIVEITPKVGKGRKKSEPQKSVKREKSTGNYFAIQTLTTKRGYIAAAEREKRRIERFGLKCYLQQGNYLYLRCNPSKNREDLREGENILKSRGVDYFLVKDDNIPSELIENSTLSARVTEREERRVATPPKERERAVVTPPRERERVVVIPPRDREQRVVASPRDRENSGADSADREERENLPPPIARNPRELLTQNPRTVSEQNPREERSRPGTALHLLKGGKSQYTADQGYKALNAKQLSKAKEIFGDILKYNELDIDASFGYALAFMNEGDWLKAYVTLSKVIELAKDRDDIQKTYKSIIYNMNLKRGWKNVATEPDKSIAFFKKAGEVEMTADVSEGLAYAFNNSKDYDKAIPEAKKIFKKKKDFKSANLLIDVYLKAKREPEAEEFFNSLDPNFQANLTYNPKREKLLREVATLIKDQHYHQAKSLLRELYLMFPTNLEVLLDFGDVYSAEKRYKNATEYYQTVLNREATNKRALEGLSKVYIAEEKYSDALQLLTKLKEDNTVNVDGLINSTKLKLYMKDGNKKEALVLAKEMLLDDPTNVELYLILGDVNIELQKTRDAYFYYGRAFQLEPDNFTIRMKLLELLLQQNLFDQTQTLLGKFEGYPLSPEQRNQLREFYVKFYKKYTAVSLEEKDYVYALRGAKSGLQMEPEDTFFIESAGWAGLNSKKYNDAIFYFNKMLAKDPKNHTIMYGLGLAYVNLKQLDKAKRYFKMAEGSNDADLLYKVAEIYKDIGFKKDSYRVVKLIEELGRRSLVKVAPKPQRREDRFAPVTATAMPQSPSYKDEINTFNPFLSMSGEPKITQTIVEPPTEEFREPPQQTISTSAPTVVPQPQEIEFKKKSGGFLNW
jgi:cytochrome c-type biogenesis protein CcmH/NrfG